MNPQSRLRRSADTAWRRVDDEVAIISMDANRIRLLNAVGSFLWERCDGATVGELVDAVCARYDIDTETAARDVEAFVTDLEGRGLLSSEAPR
ncbi:MAG: PqqD family protein [Polyangiales bacterium]